MRRPCRRPLDVVEVVPQCRLSAPGSSKKVLAATFVLLLLLLLPLLLPLAGAHRPINSAHGGKPSPTPPGPTANEEMKAAAVGAPPAATVKHARVAVAAAAADVHPQPQQQQQPPHQSHAAPPLALPPPPLSQVEQREAELSGNLLESCRVVGCSWMTGQRTTFQATLSAGEMATLVSRPESRPGAVQAGFARVAVRFVLVDDGKVRFPDKWPGKASLKILARGAMSIVFDTISPNPNGGPPPLPPRPSVDISSYMMRPIGATATATPSSTNSNTAVPAVATFAVETAHVPANPSLRWLVVVTFSVLRGIDDILKQVPFTDDASDKERLGALCDGDDDDDDDEEEEEDDARAPSMESDFDLATMFANEKPRDSEEMKPSEGEEEDDVVVVKGVTRRNQNGEAVVDLLESDSEQDDLCSFDDPLPAAPAPDDPDPFACLDNLGVEEGDEEEEEEEDDLPDVAVKRVVSVSLRDPLSLTRIVHAVRGRECLHVQCFDLTSYIRTQRTAKLPDWKCPVCARPTPFQALVLDSWFQGVLNVAPRRVRSVRVRANAEWRVEQGDADDGGDEDDREGGAAPTAAAATTGSRGGGSQSDSEESEEDEAYLRSQQMFAKMRSASSAAAAAAVRPTTTTTTTTKSAARPGASHKRSHSAMHSRPATSTSSSTAAVELLDDDDDLF